MKPRMWAAAVGTLLCVRLAGAQSIEMSAKPIVLTPAAEVGSKVRVKWTVKQEAGVALQVVDAAGKVIRTLDAGRMAVGDYNVICDGRDATGKPLPAGEYVLRLGATPKAEAQMDFGGAGFIGRCIRKFKFSDSRKFDLGSKPVPVQTVKAKVDGEAWDREEDFALTGDNFKVDGANGIVEFNPAGALNKGSEIEISWAVGAPLENPFAVKTAPDGSLYVDDCLSVLDSVNKQTKQRIGLVYKLDADGKPVTGFGKNGSIEISGMDIAVDADGMLYAVRGDGHWVEVYDSQGVLKYHVSGYLDPGRAYDHNKGPEGSCGITGIALNESKRLITYNEVNVTNVLYDATKPNFEGYIAIQRNVPYPPIVGYYYGPCLAATGDFFYETTCWDNVYKYHFDPATKEFTTVWNLPVHNGFIEMPKGDADLWNGLGIELDHTGLIYVADRENHRIQIFFDAGPTYKHVGSIGSAGADIAKCQMMAPHAICLSPDGKSLYVADDGVFIKEADFPVTHGLARVTKLKLGFGEVVEAKLTIK